MLIVKDCKFNINEIYLLLNYDYKYQYIIFVKYINMFRFIFY